MPLPKIPGTVNPIKLVDDKTGVNMSFPEKFKLLHHGLV